MLKKTLALVLTLFTVSLSISNGQSVPSSSKKDLSQIEKKYQNEKDFTPQQLLEMEKILQDGNYPLFYE
jgi:hypothetical protein